jgi:cytochrome c peroxidase
LQVRLFNCYKMENNSLLMNQKTILMISSIAALLSAAISSSGADTPLDAAALRAKAKALIQPLPDKMPGAEKDLPATIALGQKLYFEKRLSVNGKQSCNDCHMVDQNRAGVDNEPTSEGAHGKRGDRNSPTTLNAGFHFTQFWDGRAKDLVEQAKGPVLNPGEMAMPDEKEVVSRLETDADYPRLFKAAFPGEDKPITYQNFARAVAAFERTLITHDRFDDFLKGDDRAMKPQELQGLDLFLTVGCTTCHVGPTIGGNMYQKIGLIHPYANTNDVGRIKVTGEEWDQYRFKVPSLRNVALTYPYFHDGQARELRSAVKQMAYMQLGKELTDNEISSLTAFLNSLSDKTRKASK